MLLNKAADYRMDRTLLEAIASLWDEIDAGEPFIEGPRTLCLTMLDDLACKLEDAREQLETGLALNDDGGDEDRVSNHFCHAMSALLAARTALGDRPSSPWRNALD